GWGCDCEVYLRIAADGSVIVHEYGGGAENVFAPPAFDAAGMEAVLTTLEGAARTTNTIKNQEEAAAYRKRLRSDATYRNDEWERFRRLRLVTPRDIAVGTRLRSDRFGYQVVTRIKDGYQRILENGRTETYDDK